MGLVLSLGGRPKEEGGHQPIKLSLNKFTRSALKKVKDGEGNLSKFVEEELRPTLEKLDPNEASIHVWRIEQYLSQQIIEETQKGNVETAKAIGSIAVAIENFRKLSGIPPSGFKLQQPSTGMLEYVLNDVIKAVDELRREFRLFREPSVKEVAVKLGETPETLRSTLYKLASKIEWKEQEKAEAEKEAEEAINLAGWLKWLEKKEEEKFREISEIIEAEGLRGMNALQIRQVFRRKIEELNGTAEGESEKASKNILIRAKRILKEFPALIPDVKPISAGARLSEWPEETKRTWFRLFGTEPPIGIPREEAVVQAIKNWREIGFRNPNLREIVDETGLPLEEAERLAHKTKNQTGWTMPNEAIKLYASEKLGEVLVCAARIGDGKVGEDGKSEDFDYDGELEIVGEAKRFLKEHSEMLPKLTEDGEDVVSWPQQALKYLGKIYKPKNRGRPFLRVIPR